LLTNQLPLFQAQELCLFTEELRQELRALRPRQPVYVIWYDSVCYDTGKLQWQSRLNEKNEPFFQACDGIFCDYHWRLEHLSESATRAGKRARDVFVGTDVFGRGTWGGGKFDSWKAVEKTREQGMSVALFGQAWTYECNKGIEDRARFEENEDRLWHGVDCRNVLTGGAPRHSQLE
jgi:endo-beta-N-acetylglucosaminidase D